jgi:hypothetical protein
MYLGPAGCYFLYLALAHVSESQVSAVNDWLGRIALALSGALILF